MTSEQNTQRVFVKVVGFTDVERHALNTVFRLSEQRDIRYSLWRAEAPELPTLTLVDGLSYESRVLLTLPDDPELKLIWIDTHPPANACRTFERPLSWPEVLSAMDELLTAPEVIDLDLDFDSAG